MKAAQAWGAREKVISCSTMPGCCRGHSTVEGGDGLEDRELRSVVVMVAVVIRAFVLAIFGFLDGGRSSIRRRVDRPALRPTLRQSVRANRLVQLRAKVCMTNWRCAGAG